MQAPAFCAISAQNVAPVDFAPVHEGGDDPRAQAGLRAFELMLLRLLGVMPELAVVTATQQPVQVGQSYALRPEHGVVPSSGSPEETPGLPGALLLELEQALSQGQLDLTQKACLHALGPLRAALRHLLHHHFGTAPLRTRQVFLGVQRLLETPPPSAR